MTDKSLKEKAILFKGKKYVLVADRINYFNEIYPKGSIKTELLSTADADMVVVKATVVPQEGQVFTGMSQAKYSDTQSFVNKTSALENAETSAVGRALAFMGIGVIDSIASVDEINKTTYSRGYSADVPVKTTEEKFCELHGVKLIKLSDPENPGLTYFAHIGTMGTKCYGKPKAK